MAELIQGRRGGRELCSRAESVQVVDVEALDFVHELKKMRFAFQPSEILKNDFNSNSRSPCTFLFFY